MRGSLPAAPPRRPRAPTPDSGGRACGGDGGDPLSLLCRGRCHCGLAMGCSSSKNSVQEFTAPKGGGGPTEAEGTAASTPTKEPAAAKDAAASSLPWAGLDVATPGLA